MASESPQMQHQQQNSSAVDPIKVTRGHSCVLCQQRKVRCDKNKPCANCIKAQVECRVVPPQPPRRRKKKLSERELVERLRRYESLLAENGIDFDASGVPGSSHGDDVNELENDLGALRTDNSRLFPYVREVDDTPAYTYQFSASEDFMHESSEDEYQGSSIHQAYDKMFDDSDAFPFSVCGRSEKITDFHPSAVHIFQLWNIYLNNVNPLLKITHTPTMQGRIIEAATNLTKIPKGTEALMFAIYLMAIISLTEDECLTTFKESKKVLMTRYHTGTQQSLVNAEFMRSNDMTVLQAYLLYLVRLPFLASRTPSNNNQLGIRWYVDPRSLFCLVGIGVRVAHRLGLHRDGTLFGLPPFEVEMRRRLWWQLVTLDKRIGEMTGSTITALTQGADTKVPLNINDADLHIHSKEAPRPQAGVTEMTFSLTRMELVKVVRPDSSDSAARGGGFFPASKKPEGPSVAVDIEANLQTQRPRSNLDAFCQYMEDQYLRHCDPKIPLHLFTILMTRQALWKMRVIHYMCIEVDTKRAAAAAMTPSSTISQTSSPGTPQKQQQQQQQQGATPRTHSVKSPSPAAAAAVAASASGINREIPFLAAIHTLEADNTLHTSQSLKGYHWYALMHLPFPSYMFLIHELRRVTSGELCERAWHAIAENHEKRRAIMTIRNPMHIAMGHLFVKAWDAHAAADQAAGRESGECPLFVRKLKEHMVKHGVQDGRAGHTINMAVTGSGFVDGYAGNDPGGVLVPGLEPGRSQNGGSEPAPGKPGTSRGLQFGGSSSDMAQQGQQYQQQQQHQHQHQQQHQQTHPAVHPQASHHIHSSSMSSISGGPMTSVESPPSPTMMEGLDMFGSDGMGQFFGSGDFGGEFGDIDWTLMLPPEFGGSSGGVPNGGGLGGWGKM
ncbi:putative c6 zinc finger domain-containing protein [Zalerion maritima]|uniref:C6 zinc finger domain-containing protein n=1 Tax=Zalerion maritima TaxID=339359 RepID=A0AAD5WYU5_9PEZI|nr:putative c6 zinc finger domain-containing protein [Zalerion maritima]